MDSATYVKCLELAAQVYKGTGVAAGTVMLAAHTFCTRLEELRADERVQVGQQAEMRPVLGMPGKK